MTKQRTASKVCNKCGTGTPRVTDSRGEIYLDHHTTRRRLVCDTCGAKYNTLEVEADFLRQLERAAVRAVELAAPMQHLGRTLEKVGKQISQRNPGR